MTGPTSTDLPVVRALAEAAVAWRGRPARPVPLAAVRRALVDWLGVAIGGSAERPARALLHGLAPLSGPCRIVGQGGGADPTIAALVNGTAAHTLELDDIYAPGLFHPGAPVIAAALAVADHVGASGDQLVRAIVAGYEVGCAVATDLGPAHYEHWHTTGTAGVLGAAAAAASLRGADAAITAHALALGATMAAGLQQTFRSEAMGKPVHAGHAAHAGVTAAVLALGGVTGAPDALEGEAGLARATGVDTHWTASRSAFGETLAIEQITVKPYPCCGHTFAAIDAAVSLRGRIPPGARVTRVEVKTYAAALRVAGIPAPRTVPERRFSLPFVVAAGLVDGTVGRSTFLEPPSEKRNDLLRQVHLGLDQELEAAFPARRGARVVVTTAAGAQYSELVADRSGSPQNPLSDAQVVTKSLSGIGSVDPDLGSVVLESIDAMIAGDVRELRVAAQLSERPGWAPPGTHDPLIRK